MKAAIVCTTIFNLEFLESFAANLEAHGRLDDVEVIVIPDRKSPASSWAVAEAARRRGVRVAYPAMEEQERYLDRFPRLKPLIPYDSDNRRNIGYLMALEGGAELVVSIDDDNFPAAEHDFIGEHAVCGARRTLDTVSAPGGWYNICNLLETTPVGVALFPRGFPYRARRADLAHGFSPQDRRIGVNVGLWTGDPDVDAISRNFVTGRARRWTGRTIGLARGTWSPINTQNTGLHRELVPAYYYILMGEKIGGLVIDRFGDILSGFFLKKVCEHLDWGIKVGGPICDHRRTPHNLFKDLYHELAGIALLEDFTAWLEALKLEGATVPDAYRSLAEHIEAGVEGFRGYLWQDDARAYFRKIARAMKVWIDVAEKL